MVFKDDGLQEKRLTHADIPPRFKNATLASLDGNKHMTPEHKDAIKSFLSGTGWRSLVLIGPIGTGKTHTACAVVSEWCKKHNGLYTTARSMSERIMSDRNGNYFTKYSLLAIDEIGRTFTTKAEEDRFFDVINYRYENLLPTIFSGNISGDNFRELLGDAITDRINENRYYVPMVGESLRGKL